MPCLGAGVVVVGGVKDGEDGYHIVAVDEEVEEVVLEARGGC